MNINFGLGNRRDAQVKIQSDMYNSIINNQKMLAHALRMNVARQGATPAPAPAPAPVVVVPTPAPAPVVVVPAPAPAPVVVVPAPAPVVVVPAPVHRVHKKSKFNGLLSQMNEQRKKIN
jgi:hypothetical protein